MGTNVLVMVLALRLAKNANNIQIVLKNMLVLSIIVLSQKILLGLAIIIYNVLLNTIVSIMNVHLVLMLSMVFANLSEKIFAPYLLKLAHAGPENYATSTMLK